MTEGEEEGMTFRVGNEKEEGDTEDRGGGEADGDRGTEEKNPQSLACLH